MKEEQRPGGKLEQLRQRVAELEQAANKQEQMEEALRESEKQYRDLVENLTEVIYAANNNGIITYISPAIESLIEYTPSEVIGSHFGKYIHQDDLPRLKESFASILSGVLAENEYRVFTESGEIRWIRTSSRPTYEGNRVVGVHGVLSNITKWKQTEEALAQRVGQLQIIGEVARKASSFLDPYLLLSYVVTAIQQRFGYYHVDAFLVDKTQDYAVFETSSSPSVSEQRKDSIQRFKVGKEGMIGCVANTGEPLLANDVSREPRYLPDELLPDIRSELVVPLKVEDQILGVLDIDSDKLGSFDEEDIFVLQTLANQLAIALGNARLYEETRQLAAFNEGIVENVVVGISVEDADGNFTFLNPAAADLLGYPIEELIGQHWTTVVPPDQQAIVQETLKQRLTEMASSYELEIVRKDGHRRCMLVSESPRFEQGRFAGVQTVFTNITLQKQAEEEIRKLNQYFESIIDNANVWLSVLDKNGHVLTWNRAAEAISGYSKEEVVGHGHGNRIWEWLYPDETDREKVSAKVDAILKGRVREFDDETTIRCKDGQAKIISWHVRSLHDDTGRPMGFLSIGLDITERKRTEEQLAFMATHEPLTNLPNRQAFNDRLDLELSHAYRNQRQLAVMMLDLDHFKKVNDTLGHSVGDKLLQAVGKRLTGLRRKSDTVARLGGDEFMLILPEITQYEDAERIAQELLQAVREPLVVDRHKLRVTTSIGVVLYPEDADNAEALVKNADIAMYRAKGKGRNTYQRYTMVANHEATE